MNQPWFQDYNPFGNAAISTIVATIPVLILFYCLAIRKTKAYLAAVYALVAAVLSALFVFGMPVHMVAAAVTHGLVYGVIRIAWVLLAAVFVYELTVETGYFETIKASIGNITDDRRLQVLLIAFAFGALLEGSGGGGAPVAITGAMMVGIGFKPFETALMCLIANSAPVAYGGMGNPIRTLVAVTGLARTRCERHGGPNSAADHAHSAVLPDSDHGKRASGDAGVARDCWPAASPSAASSSSGRTT